MMTVVLVHTRVVAVSVSGLTLPEEDEEGDDPYWSSLVQEERLKHILESLMIFGFISKPKLSGLGAL